MTELWSADQRVLAEIVRQIEVDGLDFADCYAAFDALELDYEVGSRSVKRLAKAGMLDGQMTLGGTWAISGVTERGLREARWPSTGPPSRAHSASCGTPSPPFTTSART
jgi:hypothetical protein